MVWAKIYDFLSREESVFDTKYESSLLLRKVGTCLPDTRPHSTVLLNPVNDSRHDMSNILLLLLVESWSG